MKTLQNNNKVVSYRFIYFHINIIDFLSFNLSNSRKINYSFMFKKIYTSHIVFIYLIINKMDKQN